MVEVKEGSGSARSLWCAKHQPWAVAAASEATTAAVVEAAAVLVVPVAPYDIRVAVVVAALRCRHSAVIQGLLFTGDGKGDRPPNYPGAWQAVVKHAPATSFTSCAWD